MDPNKKYLKEIIDAFVIPRKKARFSELVNSTRRYPDFLNELFIDQRNLDPECIHKLPKGVASVEAVTAYLRKICDTQQTYVVSEDFDIDGSVGDLESIAPGQVGRNAGILLYFIGDGSAYFEDSEIAKLVLRAKGNG